MSLKHDISLWDKKSVKVIADIYAQHWANPEFLEQLVNFTSIAELQTGTTWLLKHHLERTREPIAQHLTDALFLHLDQLNDWEARLHILQCIDYLPVPAGHREKVEKFIRENLKNEAKFVRAWSYNAFYRLASQYSDLQLEVRKLLATAHEEETAASVKARIRNILKNNS